MSYTKFIDDIVAEYDARKAEIAENISSLELDDFTNGNVLLLSTRIPLVSYLHRLKDAKNKDTDALMESDPRMSEFDTAMKEIEERGSLAEKHIKEALYDNDALVSARFKELVKEEYFMVNPSVKSPDDIFEILFARAWNDAHAEGYYAVAEKFDEYNRFADKIISASV